jgi:hypothetical protein
VNAAWLAAVDAAGALAAVLGAAALGAAALGLGLGVVPAQALKMIAAEPNTAHSGNLRVRDMP